MWVLSKNYNWLKIVKCELINKFNSVTQTCLESIFMIFHGNFAVLDATQLCYRFCCLLLYILFITSTFWYNYLELIVIIS